MLDRKTIKQHAKSVLSANYGVIIGTFAVYALISFVCGMVPYIGGIACMIVVPVVMIGMMNLLVRLYRGEKVEFSDMFNGFQNFGHNLGGYWYMYLFLFLWTLLFYIPGIIKGYAYFMAPYILMDQPEIDATEALEKSKQMTNGHKMDLFVMHLSFIGWALLSVFTFGLLSFFYVVPYMMLTSAGYYVVLRNQEIYSTGGAAAYTPNTPNSFEPNSFTQPDYYQSQSAYQPMNNFTSNPVLTDSNPYMDNKIEDENTSENPYMQDMGNDQV